MVPTARIGDDTVARPGEYRLLVRPARRAASKGVEQDNRFAISASVPVRQFDGWQREQSLSGRRLRRRRRPRCLRSQWSGIAIGGAGGPTTEQSNPRHHAAQEKGATV